MVKQNALFKQPYKYIIDSCALMSQKDKNEKHYRGINRTLWENIDRLIKENIIVSCSEIHEEINKKDDTVKGWFNKSGCFCFEIDEDIQTRVIDILKKHPKMIDFKDNKSSADPFLIATAMEHELTIITEEGKQKQYKIPMICKALGLDCIDIYDLCEREGWVF